MKLTLLRSIAMGIAIAILAAQAHSAGVGVGFSSLGYDTLDYSDTFTGTDAGGQPDRPYIPAIQPAPAYVVESTYANPSQSFGGASFSFAADGPVPGSTGAPACR